LPFIPYLYRDCRLGTLCAGHLSSYSGESAKKQEKTIKRIALALIGRHWNLHYSWRSYVCFKSHACNWAGQHCLFRPWRVPL